MTFIKESRTNLDRKEFNAHLDQLALSSQSLSEGRENDYIYSRIQDVALRGLVKKDELMKLFEVRREEDIRVERLSDPAVRANLLRRNADSIAALGLFLSRKSMTTLGAVSSGINLLKKKPGIQPGFLNGQARLTALPPPGCR